MTKAAIYTRVSSDPRGLGRSVSEQEAECRVVCTREGWTVAYVLSDNDRSASRYAKKARPGYEAVLDFIRGGQVDVLVVWEISRATRDRLVWAMLVEQCLAHGVKLCVGGKLHDFDDPDDAFMLDLTAGLAVRESSITRKRVMRSMRANAVRGRPHGKFLYGYRREYDPTTGDLVRQVPRDDQAAIVRELASRVCAGESLYALARELNGRGIPAPRTEKWRPETIKVVLVNPAYIARRIHQGRDIGPADWEPILDPDTYYTAKARLTDPARKRVRDGSIKHLLSGIARCGVCGTPLRVQKNRNHLAYLCPAFHVSRHKDKLEGLIVSLVVARLEAPDAASVWRGGSSDLSETLSRLEGSRARLDGFYDAAARGELTAGALARIEQTLLPEIEGAERQAMVGRVHPVLRQVMGVNVGERWDELSMPQRREIVNLLMMVEVLEAGRGKRTFDPARIRVTWRESDVAEPAVTGEVVAPLQVVG